MPSWTAWKTANRRPTIYSAETQQRKKVKTMKLVMKKIFAFLAIPIRLAVFIFRGPGKGKNPLAGRYTRPDGIGAS